MTPYLAFLFINVHFFIFTLEASTDEANGSTVIALLLRSLEPETAFPFVVVVAAIVEDAVARFLFTL